MENKMSSSHLAYWVKSKDLEELAFMEESVKKLLEMLHEQALFTNEEFAALEKAFLQAIKEEKVKLMLKQKLSNLNSRFSHLLAMSRFEVDEQRKSSSFNYFNYHCDLLSYGK